jgi:glyoxylase-like metal-dependent hydrolase (beta-lactamase superfamily II)
MSAWTELSPRVRVRSSKCYEMNSLLAHHNGHVLLVDPGVLPSELDDIAAATQAITTRLDAVSVVFTHPHWDHVLGMPWFPGATTFAHSGFGDELLRDEAEIRKSADKGLAEHGEKLPHPFQAYVPGLTGHGTVLLHMGPFEVVTYDTPGHNGSHLAYWLPQHGVLFAGDLLSDIEIPWLDGPPWVYRASLKSLHWLFEQEDVRTLVPGHGPVASGRLAGYRRLLRDMNYLMVLEERVGAAWKRGLSLEATRGELADMEYVGKDGAYPMNDVHAENVRFTWQALADGAMPESGR